MSLRCMPILLINMGGEMMYVLEQRLKNVENDRAQKVLQDILYTMLNKKFMDELFKPQEIHSRRTMRQFFEKLAHSSIMRLNDSSMDKLFDLMTMTCKYEIQLMTMPDQILAVTLNHLDGIRELLPGDEELTKLLDNAHAMFMSCYRGCPPWELSMIRNCLLTFFLESKVKVSLLLREKKQGDDSHFVLFPGDEILISKDTEPPGSVRYYENGQLTRSVPFNMPGTFATMEDKENFNLGEKRTTSLGLNMYRGVPDSTQVKGGGGTGKVADSVPEGDELKLLSALMSRQSTSEGAFDLSLFADSAEEKLFATETEKNIVVKRIDANKAKKTINSAMEEMKIDSTTSTKKKGKGEDMLDLLDEAASRPATAKKPARGRSASRGRERSASTKRKT